MKNLLAVLAVPSLAFTACDQKTDNGAGNSSDANQSQSSAGSNPSTGSSGAAFHSSLSHVVSNLDTNGSHFSVTHIDQDLKQMAKSLDGLLEMARQGSNDIPPNLSLVNLLNDLGLDNIDAMGRSTRCNDSAWHNRMFIQTGGNRDGLLSVMGAEGSTWRAGEIAPSDADMVIEFDLNLRRLAQTSKLIATSFGEEAQQSFAEAMKEKVADGALTLGDLFGKMDIRATLVVSLDREKRWNVQDDLKLPTMYAALRVERALWLWKHLGEKIESDAEVSERDGLKIVKAPEEMPTPMGKIRPVFVLDEANDVIWLALSEDYLEKCRSSKAKLASSDDFKKATTGFPAKGNGLLYVSSDFCKELVAQIGQMRENMGNASKELAIFDGLLGLADLSEDKVSQGYAWCVANTETGILCVGNAPFPDKGYGMLNSASSIAAMSAMATPALLKQKKKAELAVAINNMKQMYFLLVEYDQDEGAFPKQLSDLVASGLVDQETLNMLNQCQMEGEAKPLVYIPGFSTSDNHGTIILHTPGPIDGKYAFLRIDGAVKSLPEAQFKELIANQKKAD